jgi:hypothetical protein
VTRAEGLLVLLPITSSYVILAILSVAHYGWRALSVQATGGWQNVLRVAGAILLPAALGVLALTADLSRAAVAEHDVTVAKSPGGGHLLAVATRGAFGFGSHTISFYYSRQDGPRHRIMSTRLANDGKRRVDGANVRVTWLDDRRAEVLLRGEEQDDATVAIELLGNQVLVGSGDRVQRVPLSIVGTFITPIQERAAPILLTFVAFAVLAGWNVWLLFQVRRLPKASP